VAPLVVSDRQPSVPLPCSFWTSSEKRELVLNGQLPQLSQGTPLSRHLFPLSACPREAING